MLKLRNVKESRGQALVELALVLPLLLLLLWGIVEIGRLGHAYLTVTYAAREGARLGAVGAGDAEIRDAVLSRAASLQADKVDIAVTPAPGDRYSGAPLQVSVSYALDLYLPVWQVVLPDPYPVDAAAVMRIE